jgi:hypothetical protein
MQEHWLSNMAIGCDSPEFVYLRNPSGTVRLNVRRSELLDLSVELHRLSQSYVVIAQWSNAVPRASVIHVRVRRRLSPVEDADDQEAGPPYTGV